MKKTSDLFSGDRCQTSGKVKFRQKRLAKLFVHESERRQGKKFNIYKCNYCGCFHLTSNLTYKLGQPREEE